MLQQLGINPTVFYQFVIYIATFPILLLYVYKPFVKANEERENRTKGSEQLSYEFQQKTNDLQTQYQARAREITSKIQEIYSKAKTEALREHDVLVGQAKTEAQKTTDDTQKKIAIMLNSASEELRSQTSQFTMSITQKMLGKS